MKIIRSRIIGVLCVLAIAIILFSTASAGGSLIPVSFGNLTIDQVRFTAAYYRNTGKVTDDELFSYNFPGVDSGISVTPSGGGGGFDLGLPSLNQESWQTEKNTHTDFVNTDEKLKIYFPFIEVNPVRYPGFQPILPPFIP